MDYWLAVKRIGEPTTCAICGWTFEEELKKPPLGGKSTTHQPSVDHIIPKSKGGKNNKENIRWACYKCNQDRSDKPA